MLPEVEAFIEANDAVKAEVSKAYQEYRGTRSVSDEEYAKLRDAYVEVRDGQYERQNKLVTKLVEDTDNELVKFIVQNYHSEYFGQSLRVLKRLPATLAELDEFAAEQGWCSVWVDAVDHAIEAGVIKISETEAAKRKIHRFVRDEMYENEATRVMGLVEEYVELRVKQALADRIEKALNVPAGVE